MVLLDFLTTQEWTTLDKMEEVLCIKPKLLARALNFLEKASL